MAGHFALLLIMACRSLVWTQSEAARDLIQELDLLLPMMSAQPGHPYRDEAVRAIGWLKRNAASWDPASPEEGRALRDGIRRARAALQTASELAEPQRSKLFEAVAEDLQTKAEHCAQAGLAATIKTEVRTVRGSTELPDWQVLYLPRLLDLTANAQPDAFPRLSSPTVEDLAPGRYVFWARNPTTGDTSSKVTVKVGEGRETISIDLPVQ